MCTFTIQAAFQVAVGYHGNKIAKKKSKANICSLRFHICRKKMKCVIHWEYFCLFLVIKITFKHLINKPQRLKFECKPMLISVFYVQSDKGEAHARRERFPDYEHEVMTGLFEHTP